MGLITSLRSALVQAEFNKTMADFLARELAVVSIIGAFGLWWLWGWQWFFWGIILIPVTLSLLMFIPSTKIFIIGIFAVTWALPFIIAGVIGVDAAYLFAVIAFIMCFWVHEKALTWYKDLDRTDGEGNYNGNTIW